MENSYGIEAARAKLGEIADHARLSGQTIGLTRHGRTVAVIGPAHAVQPAGSVRVTLFLGDDDRVCVLPAVPRIGDTFLVESDNGSEDYWLVTNVQWGIRPGGETDVNVLCDPSDDYSQWIGSNRPTPNEK